MGHAARHTLAGSNRAQTLRSMRVKNSDQWDAAWGHDLYDIDVKYDSKANSKMIVSAAYTGSYIASQESKPVAMEDKACL